MSDLSAEQDELYERVAGIIEAARERVARSVNTAMVHAYWHIGREIVEVEQEGKSAPAMETECSSGWRPG